MKSISAGPLRLRFGGGTVPAAPVFGSGGSSGERGSCVFLYNLTESDGSGAGLAS